MADFVSPLHNLPFISSSASSSSAAAAVPEATVALSTHAGDDFGEEDACSICLEPFASEDPPTVTSCRHEYHLQCILEWSQRSKECPICWQLLILKDPASQELLAAVENERILRSKPNTVHVHEDYETYLGNVYTDDSEFEERIMRHFAAAARRARHVSRRGRQRLSGADHSTVPFPVPTSQFDSSSEERQSYRYTSLEGGSPPAFNTLPVEHAEARYEFDPSEYWTSELPSENPKSPSSSEFIAFSESIKSKFSAASARYKESISKKTQGLKEKLLARNVSVKELGKGVQREMSAGIAGFARMIDRLELTPKKTGISVPSSNCPEGTSKEKTIQEDVNTEPLAGNIGEPTRCLSSSASACVQVPSMGH